MLEIERACHGERRRAMSDPIDAYLAALHALRVDADRLPVPRVEVTARARILLGALRRQAIGSVQVGGHQLRHSGWHRLSGGLV